MQMGEANDTIVAVASGVGGAIALIRVSGSEAIAICDSVIRCRSGRKLAYEKGYTLHYVDIIDGDGAVVDDVIISLFRNPISYTGEDMVEISCHASTYIQKEILNILVNNGARVATAGEFTIRAFLAGKLDLSQAEAIADMISTTDKASHAIASNQMRGGYSLEFSALRDKLIELISLIELELDFGEEDVEFVDRAALLTIVDQILSKVEELKGTFSLGNALKDGVAVAIVGSPNAGKSTLLNAILMEDRAMVSDIAGTTRDVIEESLTLNDVRYRFLDTAGIRSTDDELEKMGIQRTFTTIDRAQVVVLMIDSVTCVSDKDQMCYVDTLIDALALQEDKQLILVLNKLDSLTKLELEVIMELARSLEGAGYSVVTMSAKSGEGIESLKSELIGLVDTSKLYSGCTIVSNARHYNALHSASISLHTAKQSLSSNISSDLLSQDLREVLHNLGLITGDITTDDILGSIFSKFCIGK